MKRPSILLSLAVGAMDATTGLLLVISPSLVFRLLGVPGTVPPVFPGWIGVFVGSIGLSYVLVLRGAEATATVWIFTAMVRTLVALFLVVKVGTGQLPAAWLTVAAVDATVAAIQWLALRAGCWKDRPA